MRAHLPELDLDVQNRSKRFLRQFQTFVFKQNILSLAIAVIIGNATNRVVSRFIDDLFMPIVNKCIPNNQWRNYGWTIGTYLDASGKTQLNKLLIGDMIGALADLVIIGLVAYLMTLLLLRPAPPGPPTRSCPFCLETIPQAATRCRACTSPVPPETPTPPPNPA